MYESKVSIVKGQAWDNFSAIRNSSIKVPGFTPIPCPTHSDYSITNICKSVGCIQPLCPQCITAHVQLHQQTKKPAKIENIINTRLGCIDKLKHILQELSSDYQKYESSCGASLQSFLEKNRNKIQFAKNKIQNFVSRYFQQLEEKLQIVQVAYLNQRQRKSKQMKAKTAPLISHIQEISQYKSQLQSEDYIPALIQLLNDPPKKPPALNKLQFQNYGQVTVDQFAFQSFKSSLQTFINVQSFLPEQNKFTQQINKDSSKFSNQIKFSRLGRSSSRQLIQSQLQNSRSNPNIQISNSRKKIFSKQKGEDSSSLIGSSMVKPVTQQNKQLKTVNISFQANYHEVSQIDYSYFMYDEGILAYFPPNQRYFYAVQAICAERGFERYQLHQDFVTPHDHQCVITPESRIFLFGGRTDNKFLPQSYEALLRTSDRGNITLRDLSPMRQPRAKFSCVFYKNTVYVFGGRNSASILSSTQKYDVAADKWYSIKSMPEPLMNTNICTFNDKIIKFGGILQNGQILNRIDIYCPQLNEWTRFSSQIPFFIRMGCCQLNKHQVLIFGGETQFNNKKSECFLLRQQKPNQLKLYPCQNTLYNQGSFQNSYIYKKSLLAIQNGQDHKNKIIMKLESGKWRFLSC